MKKQTIEEKIRNLLIDFYLRYGNPNIMTDIPKRAAIREQYSIKIKELLIKK